MNPLELDEAQGITAEMVRAYLVEKMWTLRRVGVYQEWHKPGCRFPCRETIYDKSTSLHPDGDGTHQMNLRAAIDAIAYYEQRKSQAVLRDLNPRMRTGIPSREALEAHGETGDWIWYRKALHVVRFCWSVNDHLQMVDGFDVFSTETRADEEMMQECSLWTCDTNGNKIRWPEKDGVML